MAFVTRDFIFQHKRNIVRINVPEWATPENPDPFIFVREMAVAEKDDFDKMILDKTDDSVMAKAIIASACTENGESLFSEADLNAILALGVKACDRLFRAIMKLNVANEEAIERAEKN